MAKQKDKQLMLDLMRYPAKVEFRDDHIVVIHTTSVKSFSYFAGVENDFPEDWRIVKARAGETFLVLELKPRSYFDQGSRFTVKLARNGGYVDIRWRTVLKKYPSIYDAFEKRAKEQAFLPLIRKQSKDDIYRALKNNEANIQYVRNLTQKRKLKILSEFPGCIKHMEQNPELARFLIEEHGGDYLGCIAMKFRTDSLCLNAVQRDGNAIRDVPNPTERIKLAAVANDGRALKYIKNPSFAVKVAAVNSHPDAWECIKDEKERKKIKRVKGQRKYRV